MQPVAPSDLRLSNRLSQVTSLGGYDVIRLLRRIVVLLLILNVFGLAPSNALGADSSQLTYHVAVRNPANHMAVVTMTIGTATVHSSIVLTVQGFRGSTDHIKIQSAGDNSGKDLKIEVEGRNWRVFPAGARTIIITYSADMSVPFGVPEREDTGFHSYIGISGGLIQEHQLFLRPQIDVDTVTVRFELPSGWSLYAPRAMEDDFSYVSSGQEFIGTVMRSTYIGIGLFETYSTMYEGTEIVLVISIKSRPRTSPQTILERFTRGVEALAKRFGGVPSEKLMIFLPMPELGPVTAQMNSVVVNEKLIDVDPRTVGDDSIGGSISWFNFFHQLVHPWNKFFIEPKHWIRQTWFAEGFTDYYSIVTLEQTGLWSPTEAQAKWTATVNDYLSNQYHDVPIQDASFNGVETNNHELFRWPYVKGRLIAFLLNASLTRLSNGKKNLDDLMRVMFQNYGARRVTYTTQDVISTVNSISLALPSRADYTNFFREYVIGVTARLPLRLEAGGIHVDYEALESTAKLSFSRPTTTAAQSATSTATPAAVRPTTTVPSLEFPSRVWAVGAVSVAFAAVIGVYLYMKRRGSVLRSRQQ